MLSSFVRDARQTLKSWGKFKDQTGRWPWLWIAVYALNWVVNIAVIVLAVWLAGRYHLSKWRFAGVLLLFWIPSNLFWWWLKDKVKLNQLEKQRRLARRYR
jgi:hypothetical protein